MNPFLGFDSLVSRLKRHAPSMARFEGTLYRVCDPIYANTRDVVSGAGSRRYGGRWNAPGTFATVYLATSIDGALAETLGIAKHYSFDPSRLPLTIVSIQAKIEPVLDLTSAALRRTLHLTLADILTSDWRAANADGNESMTQALGRGAYQLCYAGVIVPSAIRRTFKNLNVFPERFSKVCGLVIERPAKLPPPA